MVVFHQRLRCQDFHIVSEGEEPAPEGRAFLNLDSGNTGIVTLADHLCLFAELIINNSDEFKENLTVILVFHTQTEHTDDGYERIRIKTKSYGDFQALPKGGYVVHILGASVL